MAKMRASVINRVAAVTIFSLVVSSGTWCPLFVFTNEETVFFTVEKTERVVDSVNSDEVRAKYLIFTENETSEDTDNLLYGKFNSSDIYGLLKPGHSYEAKVVGRRKPFLSWYRNIISVKEVRR